MEKSLHSGINKETLQNEWEEYRRIPFPGSPAEENLNDLFVDLAAYDTHVAGIVTSFLKGSKADKKLVNINVTLNEKLHSYKPLDFVSKKSQEEIIVCKNRLDRLVMMVLELYDKY